MPPIFQFAFDLGKIIGTLSNQDGEVCKYLRERGIYTHDIEAAYAANLKLAEAFYREPK